MSSHRGNLNYSAAVVATLADKLPRDIPGFEGQSTFTLFMDNILLNATVFAYLRGLGIGARCTTRTNARGFPEELALQGKKTADVNWNDIGSMTVEDGKVLALTWIDNAPVQILTTVHQITPSNTFEGNRKRP